MSCGVALPCGDVHLRLDYIAINTLDRYGHGNLGGRPSFLSIRISEHLAGNHDGLVHPIRRCVHLPCRLVSGFASVSVYAL